MSKKAAKKINPATEAARSALISLSNSLREAAPLIVAMIGEEKSINEMLIDHYKSETGAKTFRTFHDWKEQGYSVKKGETAFRVWGSPIKAKAATEEGEGEASEKKYKYWPMCCLFSDQQVEKSDGQPAEKGAPALTVVKPSLCTGEKVETILRNRSSGNLGEYLGEGHNDSHYIKADGFEFKIQRRIDVDVAAWAVLNMATGQSATGAEKWDLVAAVNATCSAVEKAPQVVKVAEYRNEISALGRTFNYDRQSVVGDRERLQWREFAFRGLLELEGMTCPRAKAEDRENAASIIGQVKTFLGLSVTGDDEPTPPTTTKKKTETLPASAQVFPFVAKSSAGNPARAEKLRALAEKLTSKIDGYFANRLDNTPKRMAQAANARLEGERCKRAQAALYALADLAEAGTEPAELATVKSTKDMLTLTKLKTESRSHGFHYYQTETDEPATDTPAARAALALLKPKTAEQIKADTLREKLNGLKLASIPGFFPSPAAVCARIIERADLEAGQAVADTSAGSGAILDAAKAAADVSLEAFEVNHTLREVLTLKGYTLVGNNFLDAPAGEKYDRVLINPPFENLQDADHVRHSFDCLKPGGRLVAVMSPAAFFHSSKKAEAFRAWFESMGGELEELPEGSFKESGTMVATRLIVIDKPKTARAGDDKDNPFTRSDYERSREDRKDALTDRAQAALSNANAIYNSTRKLAQVIPFGQPILVGHHSEKGDRRFRARLDSRFNQAFGLMAKSDRLAQKAATVGTGGIASDDPQAVHKLREQLAAAEAKQARMKAANVALRRGDDSALEKMGFAPALIAKLKEPNFLGRIGFADYECQI